MRIGSGCAPPIDPSPMLALISGNDAIMVRPPPSKALSRSIGGPPSGAPIIVCIVIGGGMPGPMLGASMVRSSRSLSGCWDIGPPGGKACPPNGEGGGGAGGGGAGGCPPPTGGMGVSITIVPANLFGGGGAGGGAPGGPSIAGIIIVP
jgi:hypothetical protein